MLIDSHGRTVVSSLGWVDHASLWVLRPPSAAPEHIPLGEARHLSLHAGDGDVFAAAHHFEADRFAVTVHAFHDPARILARAEIDRGGAQLEGDASVWSRVPRHYTTYFQPSASGYCLMRVRSAEGDVEAQALDWFDARYDKGYQAVVGATEIPGRDEVIVAIQRDSRPVIHDPRIRAQVGALELCGRLGNPTLRFRRHANELWADDYDTLVVLEPGSWRRLRSRRLQGAPFGTGEFIGRFCFDADEQSCYVARPYSRDVVTLDPRNLRVRSRCRFDAQPFEAVGLDDGTVVARDWKSGVLLRGPLRRVWLG